MINADEAEAQVIALWEKHDMILPLEEQITQAVLGAVERMQTDTRILVNPEQLACASKVLDLAGYHMIDRHKNAFGDKIVMVFGW
jgi:hypothetical protein